MFIKKKKFLSFITASRFCSTDGDGGAGNGGGGAGNGGQQQGGAKPWYEGADADIIGVIQNKGWGDDPKKVVKAYSELEKSMGKARVELPGDDAKPEDWAKFFNKVGRPETADKYDLKPVDGVTINKDFDGKFRQWAYDLGLSAKQAAALYKNYNEYAKGFGSDRTAKMQNLSNEGKLSLAKDWGTEYGNKMEAVKRALQEFGVKDVTSDDLLVNPGLAKIVAEVGQKYMEGDFVGGGGGGSYGMTPEQASARINELMADNAWKSDYLKGNAEKRKIITDLQAIASNRKVQKT